MNKEGGQHRLKKSDAESGQVQGARAKFQLQVDQKVESNDEWMVIDVDEDNRKNEPVQNQQKTNASNSKQQQALLT